MILEAFSRVLHSPENRGRVPEAVLYDWLCSILLEPPGPLDHVANVLHTEIEMLDSPEEVHGVVPAYPQPDFLFSGVPNLEPDPFVFTPKTQSGNRLLRSLISFCRSFDHWQFTKWLHQVSASDFDCLPERE